MNWNRKLLYESLYAITLFLTFWAISYFIMPLNMTLLFGYVIGIFYGRLSDFYDYKRGIALWM